MSGYQGYQGIAGYQMIAIPAEENVSKEVPVVTIYTARQATFISLRLCIFEMLISGIRIMIINNPGWGMTIAAEYC
jgi:hypothetical protein